MIDPRTLRGQLALAYATALVIALIAFAVLTLFVVDRTQRSGLDERLATAMRAVTAIVDVRDGGIALDATDRRQFARIVGNHLDAAVVDVAGRTIASTALRSPPVDLGRALASGEGLSVVSVRSGEHEARVAVAAIPRHGPSLGFAIVWGDLDEVAALDRRLALTFALSIALSALLAVWAGSAIAARGLRPLTRIASLASEIEAHDLARRLDVPPRDDELGRLCATFDRMLDRLEAAFARQRRFTSDASHELRAPLSVIRAEADVALRRARSTGEYEIALRTIAIQANALEQLTRDLLAVARDESGASFTAPVAAAELVREAVATIEPLARAGGITIAIDDSGAGGGRSEVIGDPESLRRAFLCIVDNALRYARNGGVRVRIDGRGKRVGVSVADDGPGFSAEALAHATERFWRDDPARSHASGDGRTGGAGLGLAIARATVEAAGGTITLANPPDGGAVVVVDLPHASTFTGQ